MEFLQLAGKVALDIRADHKWLRLRVGDATSITVPISNGDCLDLTDAGQKYLGQRYDYFGPLRYGRKQKELKAPHFKFGHRYFEAYKFPWEASNRIDHFASVILFLLNFSDD
jgi:hypothetical protein